MAPSDPGRPPRRHEALVCEDPVDLYDLSTRFVQDGIDRHELVLVDTGTCPLTDRLRRRFAAEEGVVFANPTQPEKPVSLIERYQRVLDRGLPPGLDGCRAIGRATPHHEVAGSEWARFEAVLDDAFASYPFRTLYLYETAGASAADPVSALLDGGRVLDPLTDGAPDLEIADVTEPDGARLDVHARALVSSLRRRVVDDYVTAATEVLGNALRHGEPPVRLRLWVGEDRLVCTVVDQGEGIGDPLRGYVRPTRRGAPAEEVGRGLGLWAARQLCDALDYEQEADGFTVQLIAFDVG